MNKICHYMLCEELHCFDINNNHKIHNTLLKKNQKYVERVSHQPLEFSSLTCECNTTFFDIIYRTIDMIR